MQCTLRRHIRRRCGSRRGSDLTRATGSYTADASGSCSNIISMVQRPYENCGSPDITSARAAPEASVIRVLVVTEAICTVSSFKACMSAAIQNSWIVVGKRYDAGSGSAQYISQPLR